jgi:CheY-like chemotaxis protein
MCDRTTDPGPPRRPPGILVAEDQAGLRALLCAALSGAGFRAWAAADGEEAVRLYRAQPGEIDAALLDRVMPVKDGPAALAALRALDPALPCCLMTGAGPAAEGELLALGASCVLAKPFFLPEMVALMKGLCARGRSGPCHLAS